MRKEEVLMIMAYIVAKEEIPISKSGVLVGNASDDMASIVICKQMEMTQNVGNSLNASVADFF